MKHQCIKAYTLKEMTNMDEPCDRINKYYRHMKQKKQET